MDDFMEFIRHVEDGLDGLHFPQVPRLHVRDMENPLERYNNSELIQRYRFNREVIQQLILPLVYPIEDIVDNRGLAIAPILKLTTALRYYATGSYQRVCADLSNISQTSTSRIIKEVSQRLSLHIRRYVKFPPTLEAVADNRLKFFNIAQFPGVMGCIDGTHIEIQSPGGENAEVYRNRKGWMSLNVQVVAGACSEILDIVIRWPGSAHDSRIFNNSSVKLRYETRQLTGILLGDSAYAQNRYLYTPVPNPETEAERRYNSAHVRTRNVVERTFGRWKGMFRCLTHALQYNIRMITRIVAATAVLHNIHIKTGQHYDVEQNIPERMVPNPLLPLGPNLRGNIIRNAFIERHFNRH